MKREIVAMFACMVAALRLVALVISSPFLVIAALFWLSATILAGYVRRICEWWVENI